MQPPPLISIALCTYNGERFLRPQLESLLAQDYPNLEVVAVDDRSGDGTVAILEAYAARDPRLRLFRNPQNLGYRRNFERALGLCGGEFIAPSDQDDVWRTDKLRLLMAALGEATAVYCDSKLIDEHDRPLGRRLSQLWTMGRIDDPAGFLFGNCVSGHALLFRRSLVERALPIPEGMYHDWWLAFVAADAGGLAYCPEQLVLYRQHAASVTDSSGRRRRRWTRRPGGRSLARFEAAELRVRACAAFLGDRGGLVAEVARLWPGRRERFLFPGLAWLALRHRHRLFALQRPGRLRRLREAMALVWGLKLLRLVWPHAYVRAPPRAGGPA